MHDRPGSYYCKPAVNCIDWDNRSFSVYFWFSWKPEYAAVLNSDVDHDVLFVLLDWMAYVGALSRSKFNRGVRTKLQARPRPCITM